MKKNKVIPINQPEQQDDIESISKMNAAFEKFDENFQVFTPNLQFFEQMVIKEQQNAKKRLLRDLLLFWFVAICVVSGVLLALYKATVIFIVLQGIVICSLPLIVFWQRRKQVMDV